MIYIININLTLVDKYLVYYYIMSKKKFKVVLDSTSFNSFTGGTYTNDLTKVIRNNDDYSKPYNVYCTFISDVETSVSTGITSTNLYTLSLNLSNKSNNIYQFVNKNYCSFILPVQVNPSDNGAGPPHVGFFLQDKDQRPLYIENLNNVNNIIINVLQNGDFCTATAFYVCILTFVEV